MKKIIWVVFLLLTTILLVIVFSDNTVNNIKTDEDCSLLEIKEERNQCCEEINKDKVRVACDGNWEYVSENSRCEYICTVG
tara:strand:- start:662 stop:904 length:243 start_codon:yes stop_codon:yes gene_type:complete